MLNESSIVVVFERPMDRDLIDHWQLSVVGNMAHVVVMPHLTINIWTVSLMILSGKEKFGMSLAKLECLVWLRI